MSGQQIDSGIGTSVAAQSVRLRSKKSGAGTTSWQLDGLQSASAQGAPTWGTRNAIAGSVSNALLGLVSPSVVLANADADFQYRTTTSVNTLGFNDGGVGVTAYTNFPDDTTVVLGRSGATPTNVTRYTGDYCSGGGCLRIDVTENHFFFVSDDPASPDYQTLAPGSGSPYYTVNEAWAMNLKPGHVPYDTGEVMWAQFRFKVPPSRAQHDNVGWQLGGRVGGAGGWKFVIISPNGPGTSTGTTHVLFDGLFRGFPSAYRHVEGYSPDFTAPFDGTYLNMLPGYDKGSGSNENRYCLYPPAGGTAGCPFWEYDTWYTFMLRIKIVDYTPAGTGNQFNMWFAKQGDTQWTTLFSVQNYETAQYHGGLTDFMFTPYETTGHSGPATYHLYDELIISTKEIPLPGSQFVSQYPAWRRGLAVDVPFSIPNTEIKRYYAPSVGTTTWTLEPPYKFSPSDSDDGFIVNGWQGVARIGTELWSVACSGHGAWPNQVLSIDLMDENPVWDVVDKGSTYETAQGATTNNPYYPDGRAGGRHTNWSLYGVPAGVCPDGKKRAFTLTGYSIWNGTALGGPTFKDCSGYRCDDRDNAWDAAGTIPNYPTSPIISTGYPVGAQRISDHAVFMRCDRLNDGNDLCKYDPAANEWSVLRLYPNWFENADQSADTYQYAGGGMAHDSKRNLLFRYTDTPYKRIDLIDVSHAGTSGDPCTVSHYAIDDSSIGQSNSACLYDSDNDRMLWIVSQDGRTAGTHSFVYAFDPNNNYASSYLFQLPAVADSAPLQKAQFIPELHGWAYVHHYDQNVTFIPTKYIP